MKKFVLAALLLVSSISFAEIRPGPGGGGYGSSDVIQRVLDLERTVYDLNRRVTDLERQSSGRPDPYQPKDVACMAVADSYYTAFLGKGRTRIEAEAAALQSCQTKLNAMFCKKVTCDDQQQNRNIRGAVCVLSAASYNTTFKGEGASLLEAEYNARNACQSKLNAMFCNNNVPVRCDTY